VSYFLTTSVSIIWVDKVGRRPLLMIGSGAMALAFLGVSIGVGLGQKLPDSHGPGIAAVVLIWMYFTAFSFGWISVPWLYAAEVCLMGLDLLSILTIVADFITGEQLRHAYKGRCSCYCCRLAGELPCGSNHPTGHSPLKMGVIPHLRFIERCIRTTRLLSASRDQRPKSVPLPIAPPITSLTTVL